MSGHSRWSKIQHKKGKADAQRGNLFTKLCKAITMAAKDGGGDAEMNFSLRLAIEKAKGGNVPKDNIERAIKRGTGELKDGEEIQEVLYEGYGPGGIAVLVETLSDNKNRTVSEVKNAFTKNGGSLGSLGSVQWQFERQGVVILGHAQVSISKDDLELALIDAGASDILEFDEHLEVRCPMDKFQSVVEALKTCGVGEPEDAGLKWVAKEEVGVDDGIAEKMEKLYDALDELDDVNEIYTNEK
ncbi:MAG: YebC/PmpR family DNA-binding transcriptional regulator [Candidatus Magasanikbacteria bacterium CG10_big_fil_rev_8_21_14_0_10_42_10]|uniref:Probable transcriptional regulatory protein COU32_03065 n=2 Tax=Candidatus Magasanikiibacteriota TaxID=1752731 RepID=A0A2H0TVQ0_9BACT|nr:MAG: YebC/PmpR family DNA-binding transcriptional regulator [Candidatus Magasanikbacteria bacterium CG10_big_fil_rev_8_21_14_0_10_42_10]PIZ93222.1 MAG: YebC/PmpR family DNA-binding transcriptional regulator [Candidatus Magasanikbacteria bacterium CG_4_10_14_0_2_um_filter_41_10]